MYTRTETKSVIGVLYPLVRVSVEGWLFSFILFCVPWGWVPVTVLSQSKDKVDVSSLEWELVLLLHV